MIKKLIASALLAVGLVVAAGTTSDALPAVGPVRLGCIGIEAINNMLCPKV